MGDDNKEQQGNVTPRREQTFNETEQQRRQLWSGPTNLESEYTPISQNFYNAYQTGANQNMADYGNLMSGYGNFQSQVAQPLQQQANRTPTSFNAQQVSAPRNSAESLAGYQNFAQTGGYSSDDVRDIRARGISPIRAAYGNSMDALNRARSLGGNNGSPNYIAAVSRAQREMPQQLADATQGVNAQLAESIRNGKLSGLQGMTGITEGEAGRNLQAGLANQGADLQAQQMAEASRNSVFANQLAAGKLGLDTLGGQANVYGTTPGLTSTMGNQALQAYNQRNSLEGLRNNYGLGLVGASLDSLGTQKTPGVPWWQQLMNNAAEGAGTALAL